MKRFKNRLVVRPVLKKQKCPKVYFRSEIQSLRSKSEPPANDEKPEKRLGSKNEICDVPLSYHDMTANYVNVGRDLSPQKSHIEWNVFKERSFELICLEEIKQTFRGAKNVFLLNDVTRDVNPRRDVAQPNYTAIQFPRKN